MSDLRLKPDAFEHLFDPPVPEITEHPNMGQTVDVLFGTAELKPAGGGVVDERAWEPCQPRDFAVTYARKTFEIVWMACSKTMVSARRAGARNWLPIRMRAHERRCTVCKRIAKHFRLHGEGQCLPTR